MFVLVFKAFEVLTSLEWSLPSKSRPVYSVDEHACDYVLLGWEALRRLGFDHWLGHPCRTMSGPTCYTFATLFEVMDKLARRRIRDFVCPLGQPLASLGPRIGSFA